MHAIVVDMESIERGWIIYYFKLDKSEFRKVMTYLNEKIIRWAKRKYKKSRGGRAKFGKVIG